MNKVARLFHTIKYLKLIQIFNRIQRRCTSVPKIEVNTEIKKNIIKKKWSRKEFTSSSFLGNNRFSFLNEVSSFTHWNDESQSKLWLYNLHYFDDLNSEDALSRKDIHLNLMNKWVDENPSGFGNGWEPYPSSLRIVNWIKYFISFGLSIEKLDESLYRQCHYLMYSLEYHLLGNHLFENAKALVFAGCYFDDHRSQEWLKKGLEILDQEIPQQISKDGSNFELSPMYHNIILADMLDLYNMACTYQNVNVLMRIEDWASIITKMLNYSWHMNHPDDQVSLFNDSAVGIAPETSSLIDYAKLLGIEYQRPYSPRHLSYSYFPDAGYLTVNDGNFKAILDIAKIGPDYIPGHGHADTLSFEASFYGQRVFVNSGTSVYGLSEERLRQRKTAAHNTIEVDGLDSSEVWSGFRVARRAYPYLRSIDQNDDSLIVSASHDGYMRLKGKVTHNRDWQFTDSQLVINDNLTGHVNTAFAFLHIHPDIDVTLEGRVIYLTLPDSQILTLESNSKMLIEDSTWHPEFGKSIPNKKLVFPIENQALTVSVNY